MVSWCGIDEYFNNKQTQSSDVELTDTSYGSSGSFGSIVRYEYIGHDTYTGKRSYFRSKPKPIYGPAHKSDLDYSHSRSHFCWFLQTVAKELINFLSQKISYNYIKIDQVINVFSPNEVRSHFHICDHSIVSFWYKRIIFRVLKHSSC